MFDVLSPSSETAIWIKWHCTFHILTYTTIAHWIHSLAPNFGIGPKQPLNDMIHNVFEIFQLSCCYMEQNMPSGASSIDGRRLNTIFNDQLHRSSIGLHLLHCRCWLNSHFVLGLLEKLGKIQVKTPKSWGGGGGGGCTGTPVSSRTTCI